MGLISYVRVALVLLLMLVIAGTGYYSYVQFTSNKAELAMQVSDIFNQLALPYRIARLASEPRDAVLYIPVHGVALRAIADNWGDPRSGGRDHEGIDIFAPRGTPIFSATRGYVTRVGTNNLGGNVVWVAGRGGVRYYYAHLDRVAEGIAAGKEVTKDTVLGYVGNTGNAITTPPHLHFGMYFRGPQNPYELFIER